jgi:hypothetical protein
MATDQEKLGQLDPELVASMENAWGYEWVEKCAESMEGRWGHGWREHPSEQLSEMVSTLLAEQWHGHYDALSWVYADTAAWLESSWGSDWRTLVEQGMDARWGESGWREQTDEGKFQLLYTLLGEQSAAESAEATVSTEYPATTELQPAAATATTDAVEPEPPEMSEEEFDHYFVCRPGKEEIPDESYELIVAALRSGELKIELGV